MKLKFLILIFLLIIVLNNISCLSLNIKKLREDFDPMVENLLTGRNERNYEKYSKDFSEEMKKAVDETKFLESIESIEKKIGKYIENSKKFFIASKEKNFIIVTYKAKFTEENNLVTVRIVFEKKEDVWKISGEWYDSPKLRSN